MGWKPLMTGHKGANRIEKETMISQLEKADFNVSKYIWDDNDTLLAPNEPIIVANAYRRTIILFAYMLQREGFIPNILFADYKKEEILAYDNKYFSENKLYGDRLFYNEDASYTRLVCRMFRMCGWEFPAEYQWNYQSNPSTILQHGYMRETLLQYIDNYIYPIEEAYYQEQLYGEDESPSLEEVEDSVLEYYSEQINLTSFRCKLAEQIDAIYENYEKQDSSNPEIQKEYCYLKNLISKIMTCVAGGPCEIEKVKAWNGNYVNIYKKWFNYHSSDGVYYDVIDIFILTKPEVFLLLSLFAKETHSFIEKWSEH